LPNLSTTAGLHLTLKPLFKPFLEYYSVQTAISVPGLEYQASPTLA